MGSQFLAETKRYHYFLSNPTPETQSAPASAANASVRRLCLKILEILEEATSTCNLEAMRRGMFSQTMKNREHHASGAVKKPNAERDRCQHRINPCQTINRF
jgi:hypothetical protein